MIGRAARPVALARPLPLAGPLAGGAALLAAGAALVVYLLARFPFDGLYGQDSYAYYYQARAFWQEFTGQPAPPWALYTTAGLYHWPIGYHLHLVAGFLLAGPGLAAGRAVTLLLTVLTPALLVPLTGALWPDAPRRARVVAGVIAGGALLLVSTYMRTGLAIMADVPALFWSVLAILCVLRAWPLAPAAYPPSPRQQAAWACAGGAALGLATLTRYGAALILLPILVFWILDFGFWITGAQQHRHAGPTGTNVQSKIQNPKSKIVWLALGGGLALLPQVAYLVTHATGPGYADALSSWSPANLLRTTVSSVDGTSTFAQPMIVFYLARPLGSAGDFLSAFYLPAVAFGLATLLRQRRRAATGLLLAWWIAPALFFSGTAYQAQRFVLSYLPALTVLIGIGGATALERVRFWILDFGFWITEFRLERASVGADESAPVSDGRLRPDPKSAIQNPKSKIQNALALAVLLGIALGAWQGQRSVRDWAATQAGWQAGEQQVAAVAQRVVGPGAAAQPPRVLAFGITAALYHYTGWPVADLYNYDEPAIARFWQDPGPRLLVLPESSLATQWVGTPLAARWAWVRAHYTLVAAGQSGAYTVYRVAEGR